jgi:hypothetical protein
VPRYYDCSLDDGRTWSVRVRAAETSLVITGLIDYKPYRLRLRAVNVAGFGQMGPPVSAVAGWARTRR